MQPSMLISCDAAPRIEPRFWPVVRRNLLVWRKLAVPSVLGNIAEPLITLVAFGYGLGSLIGRWRACRTSNSSRPEASQ